MVGAGSASCRRLQRQTHTPGAPLAQVEGHAPRAAGAFQHLIASRSPRLRRRPPAAAALAPPQARQGGRALQRAACQLRVLPRHHGRRVDGSHGGCDAAWVHTRRHHGETKRCHRDTNTSTVTVACMNQSVGLTPAVPHPAPRGATIARAAACPTHCRTTWRWRLKPFWTCLTSCCACRSPTWSSCQARQGCPPPPPAAYAGSSAAAVGRCPPRPGCLLPYPHPCNSHCCCPPPPPPLNVQPFSAGCPRSGGRRCAHGWHACGTGGGRACWARAVRHAGCMLQGVLRVGAPCRAERAASSLPHACCVPHPPAGIRTARIPPTPSSCGNYRRVTPPPATRRRCRSLPRCQASTRGRTMRLKLSWPGCTPE